MNRGVIMSSHETATSFAFSRKWVPALAATFMLAASLVAVSPTPAAAATQYGPYSASGTCNFDRTEVMSATGRSATACKLITGWGWYFILN